MRISIDAGYNSTKVIGANGKNKFLSTIKERTNELETAEYIVEYQGKEYLIGTNEGIGSTSANRVNDQVFDLCLYTAIASNMKTSTDNNVRIITGLPTQFFGSQKAELINSLEGRKVSLKLNGEHKNFTITKAIVFPQSAGMFIYDKELVEDDTLIIDIGGGTLDVSYLNSSKFIKGKTFPLGINSLYDALLQELTKYGVNFSNRMKAIEIIDRGYIKSQGSKIDVTKDIDKVFATRVKEILTTVKGGFQEEYNYSSLVFIGGGSKLLQNHLNDYKILPEAEYINVQIYSIIGESKNV